MTFLTKRNIIIAVFAAAVLIPVGYFAVRSLQTFPVGNNTDIVYLGRDTVGSWLPMSSMSPTDRYYYGTDMTPEELAEYLGGEVVKLVGTDSAGEYTIRLASGKTVPIQYYGDKQSDRRSPSAWAKNTHKTHFFYIIDGYYDTLKTSVK